MHDTTDKYLLQIEPKNDRRHSNFVYDGLAKKMHNLLDIAERGPLYRGYHTCVCGITSSNYDLFVGGYITNSLAIHYLISHREEVPKSEIEKLKNVNLEKINDNLL